MVDRRRREGRGTEGAEGVGYGNFFDFWAENGAFWCILAAIFSAQLRLLLYLQKSGIIGLRKLVAVEPKPELEC